VVDATREQVWTVLTDPGVVAGLTPLVRSITDVGGGLWRWQLGGIDVLGASLSPSFTVAMGFQPRERIDITPAPPPGRSERAAVTGWYVLTEPPPRRPGVHLATSLTIAVELPLPRMSRRAVEASMQRVVDGMGVAFAKNLLAHLAEG
jgi:hypothetical protein